MRISAKIIFISLTIIVILLTGCRSAKTASDFSSPDSQRLSLNDRYSALINQYDTWTDANIPIKVSLTSPQKVSISGRAYMTRDKSVMLSMRFLGMEVLSMFVTNDSIFATDKMHKYYLAESLKQITNDYPITINDIQDLLLGKAFVLEKGTLDHTMKKSVKLVDITPEYWAIQPKKTFGSYSYAFAANNASQITSLIINKDSTTIIDCEYSQHTNCIGGTVAELLNLSLTAGKQELKASINWDIDKAKWNTGNQRTWKKPSGYTRITADQLIKAFSHQ